MANDCTMPMTLDQCVTGIAAASSTSGHASLSQALSGQSGITGAVNLNDTYGSSCALAALTIKLQSRLSPFERRGR